MRISGESVFIITRTEGGYDDRGYWSEGEVVRREIPGCIIVPKGAEVTEGDSYRWASKEVSVMAPVFLDGIEDGDELEIRGQTYFVDAPPFDHRSAFGTRAGGTEIPAVWGETT
ncbi:MAG: hypothetical protein Q4F10_04775 [Corynebacterium glutamicum]|nr:hypothetical protein [Corynebacterium glutamicum]